MLRITLAASLLGVSAIAAMPAMAEEAAPAAASLSTEATDIGTLIDTPAAKAIVDKHLPGFLDNPQMSMARSMTLRQIQGFASGAISDEALDAIDAELAALNG